MNLSMTADLAAAYTSGSQRARVVTEFWGEHNLYCPNCPSPSLKRLANNTQASDFQCSDCGYWYQLKGQKSPIRSRVNDGAYEAMLSAIRRDETPNFLFLQYELLTWRIRHLLLVPRFAFTPSAIIRRNALSPTARRAGWVGCNIALDRIPVDARIELVKAEVITPAAEVREQFQKAKRLEPISAKTRGWTLDVLNIVRRLGKTEFTNEDIYARSRELESLHPDNRHIKDKIRQQLQVLRDTGFLEHVGSGHWRSK